MTTNVVAGLGGLAASRWCREAPLAPGADAQPGERLSPDAPDADASGRRRLLVASCACGCAALALQIGWTRQLSLVLGGSTYAFSAMLVVVLVGIGLGSLAFHGALRHRTDGLRLQAWVALGLVVTACVGILSLDGLARLAGALRHFRAEATWNAVLAGGVASVLQLLPCLAMGLLLPIYAVAYAPPGKSGRAAGDVYAWNTAGTILGALGAALVLLPTWGAAATAATALGLYLLTALWLHPLRGPGQRAEALAIAAVGVGATLLAARGPDPLVANLGLYQYGDIDLREEARPPRLVYLREGVSTNVAVTVHAGDTLSLRVNGKVDASNTGDMPMQLGLAYLPRFHRPEAAEVLVIGLGSGTTAGASLLFPATRVTCVELEPAIREAAELFAAVNHEPFRSDRFRLLYQDGRGHLHGTGERYDLILSEPSNPWIAGVSSLFTREFYRLARERLAPGGIFAQWIQAYSLRPSDYALVVRTIREVFPHGALLRLSVGDTVLLASDQSLELDAATLDRAQALVDASAAIRDDLAKRFASADVRSLLLSRRLLADEGLARLLVLVGGDGIHTDWNLRLEFDAPLLLFDQRVSALDVQRRILEAAEATDFAAQWQRWGCSARQVPALRALVDFFAERDAWASAERLLAHGLGVAPEDPYFLAARFMSRQPAEEAAWDEGFERVLAASAAEAGRVGLWLQLQKRHDRAARAWRRLIRDTPHAATLWISLATTLEAAGLEDEARKALEEARRIDPFSAFVRGQAGSLLEGK